MNDEKVFRYIRIHSKNLNILTIVEDSIYDQTVTSILSAARVLCKDDLDATIDVGFIEDTAECGIESSTANAEANFNNGYFYSVASSLINR